MVSNIEQKTIYLDAFVSLDSDLLKELKLDFHFGKGGVEKDNAFKVASVIKSNRPFLEATEYIKTSKGQDMLSEWMKNNDLDTNADPDKDQRGDIDEEEHEDQSVNYLDKNVVRKRLLDKLGERLEILAHTKNNEYFKNNFYDPLEDDL